MEHLEEAIDAVLHFKKNAVLSVDIPDEVVIHVLKENEHMVKQTYEILQLTRKYEGEQIPEIVLSLVIGVYEGVLSMAHSHIKSDSYWKEKQERKMGVDVEGNIFVY